MGNERSKECIGMPRRWKGKVGTAVGVRERVSQVRSSSRKGIPSRGNSVGKSTELERTLPSGNCSCLSWQVHGYVGGIMTEPPKWAEGQESQEASTPEWNQSLILCWQLGPRSENLRLSVLDRSLRDHPVQSCHLTHREIEAHRE